MQVLLRPYGGAAQPGALAAFLVLNLTNFLLINIFLALFNLLPIPPLDGRSFLEFLPEVLAPIRDVLLRYGGFVFLALVLLGTGSGFSPLGWLMSPFWWLIDQYLGLLAKIAH